MGSLKAGDVGSFVYVFGNVVYLGGTLGLNKSGSPFVGYDILSRGRAVSVM